jgi:carboxypeptidase Q
MYRKLVLISLVCVAAISIAQHPASNGLGPQASPDSDNISRIIGAAMARGGASTFLQTLTDTIGGRVTGSPESRAAAELILTTLKQAGFETAHLEEYPLESRWQRRSATAKVLTPVTRPILIGSYAWVPGTTGQIEAPLVDLGTPAGKEIGATGNLKGAAVLVDPHEIPDNPGFVMRHLIANELAAAGAVAMLIPSDKPNRMVYTSAFGFYPRGPLPVISVAKEDALFLRRLLAKAPVRVALNIQNSFDTSPYKERNVIADIPGTNPDEIVLIGAHFDSWDPGQGANDDGSGVAAILEAARLLKALGVKPRRTIRFAFFSGEEQATLGSRAYIQAHQGELQRLSAVLIMDEGAQAPRGFQIQGRTDLKNKMEKLLSPLSSLGANGISLEASFDQDHAPFLAAGIPAATLWVDPGEYDIHHHSITDTFDKVDPRMLALDTAVMAAAAYILADAEETLSLRLSEAEATELLKKTGLESTRRMLYGSANP